MPRKYFKFLALFILIFSLLFWLTLSPEILQQNVEVTAFLNTRTYDTSKELLTITLINHSSKPLVDKSKEYFYTLYIYTPPGYGFLTVDFPEQSNTDKYHFGYDSRTGRPAMKELINNVSLPDLNEDRISIAEGFMYTGQLFPASIIYSFSRNEKFENQNFYVVFSFYQKKLGKKMCWSKIIPVKTNTIGDPVPNS